MRAFVFTDTSLRSQAGRFVWLDIDTEKARNAPIRKRLAIAALPTYYVLDPDDEHVMLRWIGSATVAQVDERLDEALGIHDPLRMDSASTDTSFAILSRSRVAMARADSLYGESKYAEAAVAYREILGSKASGEPSHPLHWQAAARATESLVFSLYEIKDFAGCASLARDSYPRWRTTSTALNLASVGLDASLQLPPTDSLRKELVAYFESATREVLANPKLDIAGDDRSGAMIVLLDARKDAGDSLGARRVATEWAALLEAAAANAKTPDERAVYDSHRLSAYLEIGQPERAIPMLEASERDLPGDYNPPARLAVAYQALKRWDEALAASDRAMTLVYGPRKLRVLQNRADILSARGDAKGARQTLEQALQTAEALPEGQRSESAIAALKKKIENLP